MNVGFAGLLKLGHDAVQRVAALGGAELPLDLSALAGFQPLQLILCFGDGRISAYRKSIANIFVMRNARRVS